MSEPSSDTAQALQQAALGAIDAVRGLLDAAEEAVADPRHLQDVMAGMGDWADKVTSTFNRSSGGDASSERDDGPGGDGTTGDEGDDNPGGAADESRRTADRGATSPERLRRISLD